MLKTEAGIGQSNNAEGIVIVLFAHGWKNNAAYDNENVQMFRAVLSELRKAEQNQSGPNPHSPRKIVGVYAGWRGLSAKWEPFKELSFWERKNTAHQVGHGALTELLAELEDHPKGQQPNDPRGWSADGPDYHRPQFRRRGGLFRHLANHHRAVRGHRRA